MYVRTNIDKGLIYVYGSNNTQYVEYISEIKYMDTHTEINGTSTPMLVSSESEMPIVSVPAPSFIMRTFDISSSSFGSFTYNFQHSISTTQFTVYPWDGEIVFQTRQPGTQGTLDLEITCVGDTSVNVTHTLESSDTQSGRNLQTSSVPAWLELDPQTGELSYNAPEVTQPSYYKVKTLSYVDDSTTPFTRVFSINVGLSTECPDGYYPIENSEICGKCSEKCKT